MSTGGRTGQDQKQDQNLGQPQEYVNEHQGESAQNSAQVGGPSASTSIREPTSTTDLLPYGSHEPARIAPFKTHPSTAIHTGASSLGELRESSDHQINISPSSLPLICGQQVGINALGSGVSRPGASPSNGLGRLQLVMGQLKGPTKLTDVSPKHPQSMADQLGLASHKPAVASELAKGSQRGVPREEPINFPPKGSSGAKPRSNTQPLGQQQGLCEDSTHPEVHHEGLMSLVPRVPLNANSHPRFQLLVPQTQPWPGDPGCQAVQLHPTANIGVDLW